MKTRKRSIFVIFLAVLALMVSALFLTFQPKTTVSASRSNLGTDTGDEWSGSQTTGNLITIGGDSTKGDGWELAKIGWSNVVESGAYANAIWYDNTNSLTDPKYGWGIQARDGTNTNEIGNDNYANGVSYRITLSEADQVKANKGDLTISASSINYRQDMLGCVHNVSLKLFFYDASGAEITGKSIEVKKAIKTSAYLLEINNGSVPQGTTYIDYYVSNHGDRNRKPFIGGISCTLSDKTAPAVSKLSLEKTSVVDSANNVAIAGNKITYYVEFDEKVSVSNYGTAKLGLNGTAIDVAVTDTKLITENGKSKVGYIFNLPTSMTTSGTLSLASISGLTVKDEAGNSYTYNNSSPAFDTLQYYKTMNVTLSGWGIGSLEKNTAVYGTDFSVNLKTNDEGYTLPTKLYSLIIGGNKVENTADKVYYIYERDALNLSKGKITIKGEYIIGDIEIKFLGVVARTSKVTFDMQQGGSGTPSLDNVKYGSAMPTIPILPLRTGYTFQGYFTQPQGKGTQYYKADGTYAKYCDFYTDKTLYAYWTVNSYTIEYNANKPTGAGTKVTGTTTNSSYTYGENKPLTPNGYSLTGWTFKGWATSADGAVVYADKENVENLTDQDGATVTLYAVWKANSYTVEYDGNKPKGASASLVGSMINISHTYDTAKTLTSNGYSLTGWTFKGWATSTDGTVEYKNQESVKNLSAQDGAIVTLYAVWEANSYTVIYDQNKPEGASSQIAGSTENSKHTYDTEKALTANGYTLTGWTFLGWSTTENGAVEYTDSKTVKNLIAADGAAYTLYAVWQANTYTVTFDTAGGSFASAVSATYDGSLPAAVKPTRRGYNFGGYFSLANGNGIQYYAVDGTATANMKYTVDGDTVLYAYWVAVRYNIDLYSEGKYVYTITNVVYGSMRLPSAADLKLVREHYDFVGWNLYDNQNWSMYSANVNYSGGIGYSEGETVTLYAAWQEKNVYTINFDANGGIGAPKMAQAHEDETVILSGDVPSRNNYTFLGWATTAGAKTAEYAAGAKLKMGNAPVTLYAVWKHNPSLTFDANGGAFASKPEALYPAAGEQTVISGLTPTRNGYLFVGWSATREPIEGAAIFREGDDFTMPEADTVLYAVWQKKKYTVTRSVAENYAIDGLNGEYYFEETATFTVTGALPKVYVNGELIEAKNGEYSFTVKGNTHVYVADGLKLSLIYSANGGSDAPWDSTSYDAGATATVSNVIPSRYGYKFLGWATDKNAVNAQYTAGGSFGFAGESVILYAVWQANSYTVKYFPNGGEKTMSDDEFSFGTEGALSKNAFEKEGYTFIGWATTENGEAVYRDGATILNLSAKDGGEITLYAVWQQTVTEITFVSERGTERNASVTVVYGENLSGDGLVLPIRGGYTFAGYYTERDGKGERIFDEKLNVAIGGQWNKNVSELTLYAYWVPVSYKIVYMNELEKAGEQSVTYDAVSCLTFASKLGIVAPEGLRFAGWTTVPSGQVVTYTDGQEISGALTQTEGEEIFLYAVFAEKEKFSVIYYANGGSNAPVDNEKYFAGAKVTFGSTIPEKEGYIFAGWSFDPNGKNIEFTYDAESGKFGVAYVEMKEGGLSLYAVWKESKTLTEQIEEANASLASAIENLEKEDGDLSTRLNELNTRLTTAETTLATLGNYVTTEEFTKEVKRLEGLITTAQKALEGKIEEVQKKLNNAIEEINKKIEDSSKADAAALAKAIEDLQTAYEAADTVLKSSLEDKDAVLDGKITQLKNDCDTADKALNEAIEAVQKKLDNAIEEINKKIEDSSNADAAALAKAIKDLQTAYEAADTVLKSSLEDKDAVLDGKITQLKNDCDTADKALNEAIEAVQKKLDNAIEEINKKIEDSSNADAAALAKAIKDLQTAYEAADTVLKSSLEDKDAVLDGKITQLKNDCDTADKALNEAIEAVQKKLDKSVLELQDSIANNKSDIEAKLANLDAAYKAAKAVIDGNIKSLKEADIALAESIAALEVSYREADEALWEGIRQVQANLDVLKQQLESKDNELNETIEALRTEQDLTDFSDKFFNFVLSLSLLCLTAAFLINARKKKIISHKKRLRK